MLSRILTYLANSWTKHLQEILKKMDLLSDDDVLECCATSACWPRFKGFFNSLGETSVLIMAMLFI